MSEKARLVDVAALSVTPVQLVTGRRDGEFPYLVVADQSLREALNVTGIASPDDRLIFEVARLRAVPVTQIGDREAVAGDKSLELFLGHPGVMGKPDLEQGIKLARDLALDPAKGGQRAQRQHRGDQHRKIETDAGKDADRGSDPDGGRRRQSTDRQPLLEYDPRSEKSYPRHDALRHARRVQVDISGEGGGKPLPPVEGHQHQRARCDAHQRVGAKPGRTAVKAALEPYQPARSERGQQVLEYGELLSFHFQSRQVTRSSAV